MTRAETAWALARYGYVLDELPNGCGLSRCPSCEGALVVGPRGGVRCLMGCKGLTVRTLLRDVLPG